MSRGGKRPPGPHLFLGSDGSVFVDVRALGPELTARLRGRRHFIGVQLEGPELDIVRRVMNETGAAHAALLVGKEIEKRGRGDG